MRTTMNRLDAALEEYRRTGDWTPVARELWTAPPVCCGCDGTDDRGPSDPWEVYSVSSSFGPDWFHRSCMEKFDPGTKNKSD